MIHRLVAVAGIGQTHFARKSGRSAWDLALEATLGALQDAGIDPRDVQRTSSGCGRGATCS
jgi:3-oxoacyl-[acyl-carrier-protein] synthase III